MRIAEWESASLADVTLAVIAGGMGTRMGKPKAWLQVGGQSILGWMLDRLQWPGPTLLVTAPSVPTPPDKKLFALHVKDSIDGQGPMRGVLTALQSSRTPLVATIAVDMPLVAKAQLEWLANQLLSSPASLAVMSEITDDGQQQIEPFPAAYRIEAATFLSSQLDSGQRSMQKLCRDPRFAALPAPADWPTEVWTNLNNPAEFEKFETAAADRLRVSTI